MEKDIIRELTAEEVETINGGDGWRILSFLHWMEYYGMEANNFAPAVMPYK